jgi:hypothetical protein
MRRRAWGCGGDPLVTTAEKVVVMWAKRRLGHDGDVQEIDDDDQMRDGPTSVWSRVATAGQLT